MIKRLYILLLLFPGLAIAQKVDTVSGGLNQNDVNVVRDGDLPESNSGVIRMAPAGKKGKVMKMVPDSTVQPQAVESPSYVPKDSSIQLKPARPKPAAKRGTRRQRQPSPR